MDDLYLDGFAPTRADGTRQRLVFAIVMYVVAWVFTLMAVGICVMGFTTMSWYELERRGGAIPLVVMSTGIAALGWAGYVAYGYPAVRLILDDARRLVTLRRLFGGATIEVPFERVRFVMRGRQEKRLGTVGLATGDLAYAAISHETQGIPCVYLDFKDGSPSVLLARAPREPEVLVDALNRYVGAIPSERDWNTMVEGSLAESTDDNDSI